MMARIKDALEFVGSNSANYASRIGCRTSALARSIGPKRGGIALGVLAAAVATPFIIRAIRARRDEELYDVDADFSADPAAAHKPAAKKPRRRRAFRRARGSTSTHA
jgi:hypothetical protein